MTRSGVGPVCGHGRFDRKSEPQIWDITRFTIYQLHEIFFLIGQGLRNAQETEGVVQDWLQGLAATFRRRHTTAGPTI
jgi:hypothetical protein